MERIFRKVLERHPSIGSSHEIGGTNQNMQAITTEVSSNKSNKIISILLVYPGESYLPVNPGKFKKSIISRNFKSVNKQIAFLELLNLRFIKYQYTAVPHLQAIIEIITCKN